MNVSQSPDEGILLSGAIAFVLASTTIADLGPESGRVIRTATLMIILFTVLTVGGGCHTLVEKLNLRAPSQWTDLDQSGGGGGIEAGEGGVRGGSLSRGAEHVDDDGPAEALMPEFRVETFEDGMAKLVRVGFFFLGK